MKFGKPGLELKDAVAHMATSTEVRAALRKEFGPERAAAMLEMMKRVAVEGDLGDDLHDFVLDSITNGTVVWQGLIRAEHDEFPMNVRRWGNVYIAWAMEYDEVGLFLSRSDAIAFAKSAWGQS